MSRNRRTLIAVTLLTLSVVAHASSLPPSAVKNTNENLACAHDKSDAANSATSHAEKRERSLAGIACADACVAADSTDARCYYYRGVARGHLLETMLVPSKSDIVALVTDFKTAVHLNKSYDKGGALRALGFIYLELPSLALWGSEYARDLEKAKAYADAALAVAANDAENLELAGEVAFVQKDFKSACDDFKKSLAMLDKSDLSAVEKKKLGTELQKWIGKCESK